MPECIASPAVGDKIAVPATQGLDLGHVHAELSKHKGAASAKRMTTESVSTVVVEESLAGGLREVEDGPNSWSLLHLVAVVAGKQRTFARWDTVALAKSIGADSGALGVQDVASAASSLVALRVRSPDVMTRCAKAVHHQLLCIYIYIYVCIERERERERDR